jgi:4-amino-4-deoxy-L-arabinose transferase-like glycosyltransferase
MKGLAKFIASDKFFYFILAAIGGVYIAGMFVDVMEVDAAQYAAMSMEMLHRGDYLHFFDRGHEYLDKPPLLFWLSGLSFKLFGLTNFAYKLPSVLASALAVYSTYRLGKLWYSKEAGQWAAIILASCQAFFVFNNDVRTDALLTGMVTFSIWQLSAYIQNRKTLNFLFGFIGIGFAMLAKGPIGLIVPVAAFGTHFILKREWKMIFRWEWLVGLVIIFLVLSPMLWGLYTQFDLHPEKNVNGQTGVSGLRFFFWTQSFGRVTGESVWDNNSSAFYFIPTLMWMFLPWCLWFLWAFVREIVGLVRKRFRLQAGDEAIAIGGFLLVFIALSLSHYKLPHYILVIMPLASLLLARQFWLWRESDKKDWSAGILKILQPVLLIGVIAVAAWGNAFIFPAPNRQLFIVFSILVIFALFAFIFRRDVWRIVASSAIAITAANLLMNAWFFPQLLDYQAGSVIGKEIVKDNVPVDRIRTFNIASHSLDFYSQSIIPQVFDVNHFYELRASGPVWVYTNEEGYKQMEGAGLKAESIQRFQNYAVSQLTIDFINPDTRQDKLTERYLLRY